MPVAEIDARTVIVHMSDPEFETISRIVSATLGLRMGLTKKPMVASRLVRRLRALGLPSYRAYCHHLATPSGYETEIHHLADLITTHKTSFFREADHFDYLLSHVLPQTLEEHQGRHLSAWSAACSTGEEVYSLAMALAHGAQAYGKVVVSILGTDVSSSVLETAAKGIYPETLAEDIPFELRRRYLLRSKESQKALVRVTPDLRAVCRFQQLNFMDARWALPASFDVVFCRNVLIYFSRKDQDTIISRLVHHLEPGGHLFLGHAETTDPPRFGLSLVARAVYRKVQGKANE
jgi:chemotaxis protein methyltransferase CheR